MWFSSRRFVSLFLWCIIHIGASKKSIMWSFYVKMNLFRFLMVCLYLYSCRISSYQNGRVVISLTGLTPPHFWCLLRPVFQASYVVVFFYDQWVKVRGDCSICWYLCLNFVNKQTLENIEGPIIMVE